MFKGVYLRKKYFDKIEGFLKDDMIKVITGIRRSGKSFFLKSIVNYLEKKGVRKEDIIYIDLDSEEFVDISRSEELKEIINSKIKNKRFKYLFIDEIQNVKGFEKIINAFRNKGDISIFITGSNSYLLSGELMTKLTGRYLEFEMFPLNFYEYLDMKKYFKVKISDVQKEFEKYIINGGFPKTIQYNKNSDVAKYTNEIIKQIIDKDIKKHVKIKNIDVFQKVLIYIINNFGKITSVKNIVNYFNNEEKISIKRDTIVKYLGIFENSKIIYKCNRFNLKSKKAMKGDCKYYLADMSIYFSKNIDNRINYGPVLENILFLYLSSEGYKLSVGKIGEYECDFITRIDNEYQYIQVAQTISEKETEDREYRVFSKIHDNYPKFLFTNDIFLQKRDGIKHLNIVDFLSIGNKL